MPGLGGAWRSLVAHLLWEQGVGGSNPLAPTAKLARLIREPCGCSSTVEPQPSKLVMGVRFPSPALPKRRRVQGQYIIGQKRSVDGRVGLARHEGQRHCFTICLPFAPVS
jgi:hypothetical protein